MSTTTNLTPAERAALGAAPTRLLIGGRWCDGERGATFAVEDPSTGEAIASVADATPADGLRALGAAHDAFTQPGGWRDCPPRERADILRRAYEALVARSDELALLMTLEMGKPLAESRAEVLYGASFLRWYAEEAVRIGGRFTTHEAGGGRLLTMRQPVGPCVLVTPWNFPLAMGTRKLGPAIAAGCTAVVKPASLTPLSMLALAQVLERCGLPPGVVNVITTSASGDVIGPLLADPRTRKLSFTGSTEVGRALAAQAAPRVLRVSLELGGNAPFVVFADADLDAAVDGAMVAKMRNVGEACTAANRFLVAAPIAAQFAQRLAERMGALTIGRGSADDVEVGPLIDARQLDAVAALVDDAVDRGARVLCGGERVGGAGHFYRPTVLAGVPAGARILHEEVFGPVAPITTFDDEDEAIAAANDTDYGLVAYVYTAALDRALRVAERLETGMVGLNQGLVSNAGAPFGGIKQSGIGREGGPEGIAEYLETKYVAIRA